jgi:hypothetical protein
MEEDFNYNDGSLNLSVGSKRQNFTPGKTGGKVKLNNLRDLDLERTAYIGRDAVTIIEGELR